MIKVTPRARRNADRAGDPLDGLVNLFDVGIVLAVAFLLAGLSSLGLTKAFTEQGLKQSTSDQVTVKPNETSGPVPAESETVVGNGSRVGTVYRLDDGTLVYVTGEPTSAPTP